MENLNAAKNTINHIEISKTTLNESTQENFVSFLAEVPEPLNKAMATFIESHPNWDQYRIIQAALSGFLVQNGIDSRSINRIYFENMFSKKSFVK